MKCFVISLPTSVERRARIRHQLTPLGIDYVFFDAIDFRKDRRHYFHHCSLTDFRLATGRAQPSTGEVGCYASHLTLWRTCLVMNQAIVVLEDDAEIGPHFPEALRFLSDVIDDAGFVRLHSNENTAGRYSARHTGFRYQYCKKYPAGAVAYAISPAVARSFIKHSRVFSSPVDKFIKDYWVHSNRLYALDPPVVSHGPAREPSTIGRRVPHTADTQLRIARMQRKGVDAIQRAFFNVRQSIR